MDDLVGGSAAPAAIAADGESPVVQDGKPVMRVRVYSPFKIYFDELALSITAENETGPFDILPRHHNFITLLKASELTVRRIAGADQRIRISGGIMHVKADHVVVFLDV